MEYEDAVREILSQCIPEARGIGTAGAEDSLQALGMDSIAFISVAVALENRFGFTFPDEKLLPSAADTITDLCGIVAAAVG